MEHSILPVILHLFDGADGGAGDGATGETQASSDSTRQSDTGEKVLYGKQEAKSADAGQEKEPEVQTTSNTLEDRRKAFRQLVNGEYKDIYTEETQRIIDRRFRETRGLEQRLGQTQPVIDMLMQRYGIADGDMGKLAKAVESDDAYWSAAADEAGMSVEQYKAFSRLQRENAALLRQQRNQQGRQAAQQLLQKWYTEAEAMKEAYPDFDLEAESRDRDFLSMLRAGVPVRLAYEVRHMDEIKAGVAEDTAKRTEKQVTESIRAMGSRPDENGLSSLSAFTVKDDPGKWSKKDRAEVARRAMRGETIKL